MGEQLVRGRTDIEQVDIIEPFFVVMAYRGLMVKLAWFESGFSEWK